MVTLEEAYEIAKKNIEKSMNVNIVRDTKDYYLFTRIGKNGVIPVDGKALGVRKKDGGIEWIWVHPNSKHWKVLNNGRNKCILG